MSVNFVLAKTHLSSLWRYLFCLARSFFWILLITLEKLWEPFEKFFPAPAVENTGGEPMTLHSPVSPTRSAQLCSWDAGFSSCSGLLFPCFHQTDYWCDPPSHLPLQALLEVLCCFPSPSYSSSSAGSCLWQVCPGLGWKLHAQDEFDELIDVYPIVVWKQKQKIHKASSSSLPAVNCCLKLYLPLLCLV